MKKILSVIICILLVIFSLPVCSVSADDNLYPTVVVPGYSASYLYAVEENGETRQIWGSFEGLNITDVVMSHIAEIGLGCAGTLFGNSEYLAKTVGVGLVEILGDIAYTPAGNPVVKTVTYPNDPAITNYAYLIEELNSMHAAETEIMADIADIYGENGYEYLFSFQTDFRLNIVDAIEGLDEYIDAVLEYTGAEKVNIYAVSYGGQLTASYLNVYGHLGKVHNAVLTVPAIGGAALAFDIINGDVKFDEETLFYFLENGLMLEEDINWLMKAQTLGFLDELINNLIEYGLRDILGYWGSIWDFIPAEYYEELKEKYLDPVESAALIEKSDIFHYEILPSMSEKLQSVIENGTNVYIVAGCDNTAVTGLYEQSDGIIHLNGATGAEYAPFDLRYSDGYKGKHTSCTDLTHNHISPAMNIDASTCYIPEQTWFVSGLFHGMTWKDAYVRNLCCELLFSKNLIDVYTYNEYPQFRYSTNVCHTVDFYFDNSSKGFLSDEDKKLVITNLSEEYDLYIVSVESYGIDIDFELPVCSVLKPGESVNIGYIASLPPISCSTVDISVNYFLKGSITPQGERNLTFTLMNGEAPEYNTSAPYSLAKHETCFENLTIDFFENILQKTGLFDYIKMLINCFISLFSP